ncbi:MAG: hypothetical protein JXA33_11945 [Anaerolineae bacterium]|nr:hypothetical protein [Anaerolineae bacterium]
MKLRFSLPFQLTAIHWQTIEHYLHDVEHLSSQEWATLFEAMDILRPDNVACH